MKDKLEDLKLVRINKSLLEQESIDVEGDVGIVFPVYYYGLPLMVKEFIKKLVSKPSAYHFAVATCGGSVGAAMRQMKKLIESKGQGKNLSAGFRLLMPDNYQLLFEPSKEDEQRRILTVQEAQMQDIAEVIRKKQKVKFHEKGKYPTKLLGGAMSAAFSPKKKDKNFWTDEKCNCCSICVKVCPAENIVMRHCKPVWTGQCELCLACMQWCPKKAIQYKKRTIKRGRYHHPDIRTQEMFHVE
ncbi:MAG: 4Fe-4S ferredoxin [Herbinix sp.]|nr:4Fe-4S ferredoxin [Herbinix sp.]